MKHRIGQIVVNIDVESTHQLYTTLSAKSRDDSNYTNFLKNILSITDIAKPFFTQFGIDVNKWQEIYAYDTDPVTGDVSYFGYYPLIGAVTEGRNKLSSFAVFCDTHNSEKTPFGFKLNYLLILDGDLAICFDVKFPNSNIKKNS